MKREEIEQLLAEYASGEISLLDRDRLEELFKQDSKLREEADEMAAVYHTLDEMAAKTKTSTAMDEQFYAMLQTEKLNKQPVKGKVIQLNVAWLKAAAALAACILAFVIGRATVAPVTLVKYRTEIVKQLVTVPQEVTKIEPTPARINKPKPDRKDIVVNNSVLAQQMRSVYASERIGALMKLANKPGLDDADLRTLEMALQEDSNPNVRLTILSALRPISAQQKVQQVLISALNRQDDELVQTSIVDMLIDNKSKKAIPQMIALLDNKHINAITQDKIKAGIESLLN